MANAAPNEARRRELNARAVDSPRAGRAQVEPSGRESSNGDIGRRLMKLKSLALLVASAVAGIAQAHAASAQAPEGIWLVNGEAAVQLFDCNNLLCGRILWLQAPRDAQGQLKRDTRNPDPALRQRQLCGLTVIRNMRASGANQWEDGWFYYPDSGKTYNVKMELTSSNVLSARLYLGTVSIGETKTLSRVAHGTSDGWC